MPAAALREPARSCDAALALAFRLQRQRLDQRTAEALPGLVASIGYVPCPGGTTPYLSIHARSPRYERRPVELAVFERGELVEVPFARRSVVLAPPSEAAALRVAAQPSYREREAPLVAARLVDANKREGLAQAVLETLARGPLAADDLRSRLPEAYCVAFGEAGRKAGIPSLFSLVLQDLWLAGRVRRLQREQRLDRDGRLYSIAQAPTALPSRVEALRFLAGRYLEAYAPATVAGFAFWADASLTEARKALGAHETVEVLIDGDREPALLPRSLSAEFDAFREPVPGRLAFVPFRDPVVSATKDLKPLLPAAHASNKLADWRGRYVPAGGGSIVHQHFLLEGGFVRGVWEYDADERRVKYATFEPLATRARRRADQAAEDLSAYIERTFGAVRYYDDDRADDFGRVADTVAQW